MNKQKSRIRKTGLGLTGIASAIVLTVSILCPVIANAFSGYGAGTSSSPYLVASCSQLQSIANNLSGDYELVRDVNCNDANIGPIGGTTDFSGILNGNGHTITDFTSGGSGLFYGLSGATVENLNLTDGTINGGGEQGSIAGTIDGNSSLTNVHSSLTVDSSGAYTGGLVGAAFDVLNIDQSSYTGNLITSSTAYNGGLVGAWEGSGSTISDSYVAGNLNLTSDLYSGGLVGGLFASSATISNSYSASSITVSGSGYNGGLVGGFFGSTLTNSFAANTYTGSDSNLGAVTGTNSGTYTNDYFDSSLAGGIACSGSGSASSCTAENVSNASPNYFKSNSTNNPLNNWNVNSTWQTVSGNYPTLQSQSDFTVASTPNGGDADGDGIADNYEPNVLSVKSSNNLWSTIVIPSSSNCDLLSGTSSTPTSTSSYLFPLANVTDFDVYCPTVGQTVSVTIILDKQYDTSSWKLLYYNPNNDKWSVISGAAFGTTVVGGVTKTTATYSLTDGGPYDSNGAASGVIADPVAIGTLPSSASASAPNTGYGAPHNSFVTLIVLISSGTTLGVGFGLFKVKRMHKL